jgi:hypothetical protein
MTEDIAASSEGRRLTVRVIEALGHLSHVFTQQREYIPADYHHTHSHC